MNKAILMGNVGADPKMRYVQTRLVAEFSLATNEPAYTTPAGVQIPERTEWHNIVLFGKLAEIARDYIRKGATLYIQGKMRTRSYDDKDGIKRYVTEIHADTVQMLDRRSTATSQQYAEPQQQYGYQQPPMNDPDLPF